MKASLLIATLCIVATILLYFSSPAWSATQDKPLPVLHFLVAFNEGADCPRLFELRNEAKRHDATNEQQKMMNEKLQSVGCIGDTSKRVPVGQPNTGDFTVREYRIYRDIISTSMSVPEAQTLDNVAQKYKLTGADVGKTVEKVQRNLFENKWLGFPELEIRHASDWNGETP